MTRKSSPPHTLDLTKPPRRTRNPLKILNSNWLWIVAAVCILALLGWGVYFFFHHQTAVSDINDVKKITQLVGRHYELPSDEQPALATITDASKLNTPFLKKAKNGDKVLIYQTNKIAIIYRPSLDRIVAVGPVTIDAPPSAARNP